MLTKRLRPTHRTRKCFPSPTPYHHVTEGLLPTFLLPSTSCPAFNKKLQGMLKRQKPQFHKRDEQAADPDSDIPSSKHGSKHNTSEKNRLSTLFWHLTPFYFASHSAIYSFYRWLSLSFSGVRIHVHAFTTALSRELRGLFLPYHPHLL